MAKTRVTKTSCDFCEAWIEDSTPTLCQIVELDKEKPRLSVDVRVSWPDGKRFTADICRRCVLRAAQLAGSAELDEPVRAGEATTLTIPDHAGLIGRLNEETKKG